MDPLGTSDLVPVKEEKKIGLFPFLKKNERINNQESKRIYHPAYNSE
jgi:hypothetical protein